jgi:hypothetical protein
MERHTKGYYQLARQMFANAACVYSMLGDLEPAFDLLERLLPHVGYERESRAAKLRGQA